jgi:nucleoside-diphosphate-sugar epimerase
VTEEIGQRLGGKRVLLIANPYADLYLAILNQRLSLLRESRVPVLVEDARDYLRLSRVMADTQPDAIVLLAAVSHASRSNKDPYHTFDHSFRTLENALDIARGHESAQFIYFSSSMVYGNFASGVAKETDHCSPLGIYGALKLGGEHLVRAYEQVFGLPATIIRPSALYGAGCVSRRVIQVFLENALTGQPLVIKGDGSEELDFTHISDLVDGVTLALMNPAAYGETFNLTYGSSRSIGAVADIVSGLVDDVRIVKEPRDSLNPERGTLDIAKARHLLSYSPGIAIETGIADYASWYRELLSDFGPRLPIASLMRAND